MTESLANTSIIIWVEDLTNFGYWNITILKDNYLCHNLQGQLSRTFHLGQHLRYYSDDRHMRLLFVHSFYWCPELTWNKNNIFSLNIIWSSKRNVHLGMPLVINFKLNMPNNDQIVWQQSLKTNFRILLYFSKWSNI